MYTLYLLTFQQMNMDTTPLEAGLDYFIKFDKVRLGFPCTIALYLFQRKILSPLWGLA